MEPEKKARKGNSSNAPSKLKQRSATVAATEYSYKDILLEISLLGEAVKEFSFDESTRVRDVIGFLKESYPDKNLSKIGLFVTSTGIWLKSTRSLSSYYLEPREHISVQRKPKPDASVGLELPNGDVQIVQYWNTTTIRGLLQSLSKKPNNFNLDNTVIFTSFDCDTTVTEIPDTSISHDKIISQLNLPQDCKLVYSDASTSGRSTMCKETLNKIPKQKMQRPSESPLVSKKTKTHVPSVSQSEGSVRPPGSPTRLNSVSKLLAISTMAVPEEILESSNRRPAGGSHIVGVTRSHSKTLLDIVPPSPRAVPTCSSAPVVRANLKSLALQILLENQTTITVTIDINSKVHALVESLPRWVETVSAEDYGLFHPSMKNRIPPNASWKSLSYIKDQDLLVLKLDKRPHVKASTKRYRASGLLSLRGAHKNRHDPSDLGMMFVPGLTDMVPEFEVPFLDLAVVQRLFRWMMILDASKEEGIFRLSPSTKTVDEILARLTDPNFDPIPNHNAHEIGGALKKYFRVSQVPAIPIENSLDIIGCHDGYSVNKEKLIEETTKLSENVLSILSLAICYLASLASHSSKTLMGLDNLAIIFGPTLFGDVNPLSTDLGKFTIISSVVSTMITCSYELFPDGEKQLLSLIESPDPVSQRCGVKLVPLENNSPVNSDFESQFSTISQLLNSSNPFQSSLGIQMLHECLADEKFKQGLHDRKDKTEVLTLLSSVTQCAVKCISTN